MDKVETGTEELLCEITDRVAIVTLNKPHKKNALGDILTPALRAVLPELESRKDVGCVLITGAGDAFCSGGDVSGMSGGSGPVRSARERIEELTRKQLTLTGRLYDLAKPTVAALPGAAAGAGLSIALACDLRVASDNAFVTTAFRNIGLSGDYGASWFLPRLVGLARAKKLMYRSERIGAAQCREFGLVDEVFPRQSFREQAFEYARDIAHGPTAALGRMKLNLQAGLEQSLALSLALEAEHMINTGDSNEAREAIRAFLEKRAPRFH
ncbi:MAG: enoyl-CoA hydratase-related protein [Proteobacteria bacterium]|jgi:enoyl-CoA hydratase/carnithine racemase|nr:enoyl-CoA hydratase-related protein [Pseudomonadota bacterium]MDA1300278.1 enoyl-CoA hydratase-related protein [Pseudomonadota bacterium]